LAHGETLGSGLFGDEHSTLAFQNTVLANPPRNCDGKVAAASIRVSDATRQIAPVRSGRPGGRSSRARESSAYG